MNSFLQLFKIYIFLIIPLGFLFPSYSIIGYVLDMDTNEPIQNAQIIAPKQNIGSTTDMEGYFNLIIEESIINNQIMSLNLVVKVIGYEDKELSINNLNTRNDLGKIF